MGNKYSIIFHPEAEKEYLDSVKWYEDSLIGLGKEFVAEVENILDHISHRPFLFPVKKFRMREAVLKKFPFVVIYEINKNQFSVNIIAVYHTSRTPAGKIRKVN